MSFANLLRRSHSSFRFRSVMANQVDHSNPITLSRFILAEQEIQGNADLSVLFTSIELACKVIASSVRRAGLTGLYGLDGSENSTGDQVKKLDVLSNDIFVNSLKFSTKIEVMVSEEEEKPIVVQSDSTGTKYCIAFDPLDGSSNIDCNVSTGTIFAIYQRDATSEGGYKDILQPGSKLVSAGYCMYGSSTQLVLTWGKGVHCFTLDPTIGAFILSQKDIRIPEEPKAIYSCNEGNYAHWDRATKAFVDECKTKPKPYAARYVGSMVSDIHRTILYGGIYLYPGSEKAKDGKLRLLYECNPMSFIMEQAGGMSTTGTERILDLVPTDIHQRSPIFLGCKRDVERVIALYKEYNLA
ncbi:Fructose-1,6-bisphosphatase 1 [Phytophthora idaei]|nr:Fructose-1,6-bisphosphatase 1 [Phytophthora idaei]KAG3142848.1 Fructose-1,6-bisphosphatase 1 [Phytophthora idaei]KAG3239601.1 Fructose-1,6-bisphosphatase 1 [Phytophthora idaei]